MMVEPGHKLALFVAIRSIYEIRSQLKIRLFRSQVGS